MSPSTTRTIGATTSCFAAARPWNKRDIERDREILDELGPGYRPKRNKSNRYLQDREAMKTWSFSGMGRIFNVHDVAIVEGCGEIVDRSKEFLGPSDKAIIVARRQLLRAIRDVDAGREGPHVIRAPDANRFPQLTVESEVLAAGADWQEHWKKKLTDSSLGGPAVDQSTVFLVMN